MIIILAKLYIQKGSSLGPSLWNHGNHQHLIRVNNLPGQGPSLHNTAWVSVPTQSAPACIGAGSVHDLSLVLSPGPQETLHTSKGPHADQFPFTGSIKTIGKRVRGIITPYTPLLYRKNGVCMGIHYLLFFLKLVRTAPQSMFWAKIRKL